MATPVIFLAYKRALLNGDAAEIDAASAVKVALIDDTLAPNSATHDNWSDLSANEVSGTGYTTGGATVASASLADDSDDVIYSHADVVWSQDGAGFADARYAVWYFVADGALIAYMDLGGDVGNVTGDLTLDVGAGGVFKQA